MAMLKFPLVIRVVAILAKMAIFPIVVMALGVINMAIWGIQLQSMKKLYQ